MSRGIDAWPQPASLSVPGASRLLDLWYSLGGAVPGGILPDRWVARPSGVLGAVTGNNINLGYTLAFDATLGIRHLQVGVPPAGGYWIQSQNTGSPPPLTPVGGVSDPDAGVWICRWLMRLGVGAFATANDADIFGFGISSAGGVRGFIGPRPHVECSYVGLLRTGLDGIVVGYRNAPNAYSTSPLPIAINPLVWTLVEHRVYQATAASYARYEMHVNGAMAFRRDWSQSNMPTPTNASIELLQPIIMRYNAASPNPQIGLHQGRMIIGPDVPSTF